MWKKVAYHRLTINSLSLSYSLLSPKSSPTIQINRLNLVYVLIITSYLTDRHFQTHVGDVFSNLAKIYAYDTPVANYANDKAIIAINNDLMVASFNLQNHLTLMEELYTKWRFNINQSKSIHTTFTLRLALWKDVFICFTHLRLLSSVKYLGIILDQRLKWARHIRSKRLHLNSRLRSLETLINNNKFTYLNIKLLNYKFLIKPIWTYGVPLWGNTKKSNINRIQTFQNIALRKLISNHTMISKWNMSKMKQNRFTKDFTGV